MTEIPCHLLVVVIAIAPTRPDGGHARLFPALVLPKFRTNQHRF